MNLAQMLVLVFLVGVVWGAVCSQWAIRILILKGKTPNFLKELGYIATEKGFGKDKDDKKD